MIFSTLFNLIFLIRFQEIVPLTAGSVLKVEDPAVVSRWESLIDEALNTNRVTDPASRYVKISSRQMV